jgi:cation:H+ antiporter
MLMYVISLLVGFLMLLWGSDRMVIGASVTARNLGVSPMLVGLTIVGFATSAPEVLVSVSAALNGVTNLAIGNALGSNIANIGLVTGVAAMIQPLTFRSQTLRRELPAMLVASLLPVALIADRSLDRIDGIILLAAFTIFVVWMIRLGLNAQGRDPLEAEYSTEIPSDVSQSAATISIIVGLLVLIAGSNALVWGASNIAIALEVSELVVGVTLVAVGTSLPELAVSIVAVRKGEHGLALGNIIGSNAFNMLAVIGVAGIIGPAAIDAEAIRLHLPTMLAFTAAFFFLTYNASGTIHISRLAGVLLLAGFIGFHSVVAYQAF